MIIYQNKITAVRCILPVIEQQKLSTQLGLRHRAALGMSELTDTLVVVVSVARKGALQQKTAISDYLYSA